MKLTQLIALLTAVTLITGAALGVSGNRDDCNGNGIPDEQDIADCTSSDCNFNGVPDECDIAADPGIDLDHDGVPDSCGLFREYVGIDPRATYLRTSDDPDALDATPIDLQAIGILPGDFIRLERLGDFGSTSGRDDGEHIEDLVVVFSSSDVLLASDQLQRVPDAIEAGEAYTTPNTLNGDLPTDIDEDFYVYIAALCVPEEARYLFVSGVDSHFGDNFDANYDFTLRVTGLPGFVDCNHNGIPDDEDIAGGTSSDVNENGVPDECEMIATDAIAVEFTVHNDLGSWELDGDAVAAEFTVYNDMYVDIEITDAHTAEFTVQNDLAGVIMTEDASTAELTVHNDLSFVGVDTDAFARQFTVYGWVVGDLDCDGDVDFDDIDLFVMALGSQAAYEAAYPDCRWLSADCDNDGDVDFDDIDPFVAILSGG